MRRSLEREMMDLPGNHRALLEEDLRNLRRFNRFLLGYRGLLDCLRRFVRAGQVKSFSLLDLGTGSADIPVAVARWASREGVEARIVGVELNPITLGVGRRQSQGLSEIALVRADVFELPFPTLSFDFVHTSQLLHHFSEQEIVGLLRNCASIARRGILVSDLIRHPLPYYGIGALTRLFTWNEMTRTDAPLSVKRAFTLGEWNGIFSRAGVGNFDLTGLFPFRMFALLRMAGFDETV